MKRILSFLLLFTYLLTGTEARAQIIGQVRYGSRIFSPCLPYTNGSDTLPMMTAERRAIALRCVERTFGKIKEYQEYYGECTESHILDVTLESGDRLYFDNGRLDGFTVVSPRFAVARDWFRGGLRVGRQPAEHRKGSIIIEASNRNPGYYHFYDTDHLNDMIYYFKLDSNGKIVEIHVSFNAC